MAEGARLESVYTFTGIGGSNPSLSASFSSLQESPPELAFSKPFPKITIHREKFICLLQSAAVIPSDDQGYLAGALQEEMSHYLLEQSATDQFTPYTTFYYPVNMFADAQTTLNTLVTLEDAFIAAYLIGVRNFSTAQLRVTAARIMGIESDHHTLARVVGPDVAAQDGGPITMITGLQGVAENVAPPNNNGYERTQCWTNIDQAVNALLPFVDLAAAKSAGFDTSKPYPFEPFNPTLPNALGDFISFTGCSAG